MTIFDDWKKAENDFTNLVNDGKHRTSQGQIKHDKASRDAGKKATKLFRQVKKSGNWF